MVTVKRGVLMDLNMPGILGTLAGYFRFYGLLTSSVPIEGRLWDIKGAQYEVEGNMSGAELGCMDFSLFSKHNPNYPLARVRLGRSSSTTLWAGVKEYPRGSWWRSNLVLLVMTDVSRLLLNTEREPT